MCNGFEVIIQEIFHQNKFLLFEFSDCLEAMFVSPSSIVGQCNRTTELLFFCIISSLILLSEYNTVIILHKNTCYFHQSFLRAWRNVPLTFYMELDQVFIYKQKAYQSLSTHWFQFFYFPPAYPPIFICLSFIAFEHNFKCSEKTLIKYIEFIITDAIYCHFDYYTACLCTSKSKYIWKSPFLKPTVVVTTSMTDMFYL